MSWLTSFLNPGKGYQNAQAQQEKYYNQSQGYLQPYNQNGIGQTQTLQDYINNLSNPQALYDKWVGGYKESEAAKQAERRAQEHGLNAASSMGLLGSNTALNAIQSGTNNIANEDKQSYLDNLMQKYLAGAGIAQGMYNTGAGAAGQQSTNANNMGTNSANNAFGQANAGGNTLANILGMFGGAFAAPTAEALVKRWNLSGGA